MYLTYFKIEENCIKKNIITNLSIILLLVDNEWWFTPHIIMM